MMVASPGALVAHAREPVVPEAIRPFNKGRDTRMPSHENGRRGIRTPDLLGVKRITLFPNLSRTVPDLPFFDTMPGVAVPLLSRRGKNRFEIDLKCRRLQTFW